MKKFVGLFAATILVVVGISGRMVYAGVDDYTISDYGISYVLSRDGEGRSVLKTTEYITAIFPQIDQNHGLERAIPETYKGHSTRLQINSVTDGSGTPLQYGTHSSNGNMVMRIGDANTYVHGIKSYQIVYTQRDVTAYFANTNDDEFYWDTNGLDWRVPIQNLSVSLRVDDGVESALNGKASCYEGFAGSQGNCVLQRDGTVFSTSASNLVPGQNMTIAVGFQPHTFAEYKMSLAEKLFILWMIVTLASIPVVLIVVVLVLLRWGRDKNRKKDITVIVPEYIPPKDASVTLSSRVIDTPKSVMTAQIIDLAVRHYVKIYQTQEKSLFKKAEYDLEIAKPINDLKWEEAELLRDLFDSKTDVGSRMSMSSLRSGTGFYNRIQNNEGGIKKRVRDEYGIRAKDPAVSARYIKTAKVLFIISIFLLSPPFLVAAIVVFVLAKILWPLTDKGVELRRYVLGLRDYIKVAETDRLRMLQSPEGAAKVGSVDVNDKAQLVKLYERVLPYAILFGIEKDWSKQLGAYYETMEAQPDWYVGRSAFNAAVFTTAMSSFNSSVSYASPSSSSTGGSGGGGFSGGGGGGGGGGGW